MQGRRKPVITNPNPTTTPISLKAAEQRQGRPPGIALPGASAQNSRHPSRARGRRVAAATATPGAKAPHKNTAATKRQKAKCPTEKRIGRYTAATETGRLVERGCGLL